jgi:hypothetical protein
MQPVLICLRLGALLSLLRKIGACTCGVCGVSLWAGRRLNGVSETCCEGEGNECKRHGWMCGKGVALATQSSPTPTRIGLPLWRSPLAERGQLQERCRWVCVCGAWFVDNCVQCGGAHTSCCLLATLSCSYRPCTCQRGRQVRVGCAWVCTCLPLRPSRLISEVGRLMLIFAFELCTHCAPPPRLVSSPFARVSGHRAALS